MEGRDVAAFLNNLPAVTKFTCFSTFLVTFSIIAQLAPVSYSYNYYAVFKNFEIWRLYTSFFIGTPKLNLVFELLTLYRCCSALEARSYFKRSSDLAWQMIFACLGIFVVTRPLQSGNFFSALLTCLCWMSAATAPIGSTTSFLGLITLPISYLPYCIIAIELLVNKPNGAARATAGAIVGFLWFWSIFRGRAQVGALARYGQAPDWFRGLFNEKRQGLNGGGLKKEYRVGQAINVSSAAGTSCCGGSSAAHVWGAGNSLG